MVEGQVESIKQQVQDIALNVRDRFKEKVSGFLKHAVSRATTANKNETQRTKGLLC
jgi:hypothetical protein